MNTEPITNALKQLGGYASVLYAFGFFAVRARLNTLGVWSRVPILDAAYLVEGALFLVTTLQVLVFPFGAMALVLASAGYLLKRRARGGVPSLHRALERAQAWMTDSSHWLQLAALLVLLYLAVPHPAVRAVSLLLVDTKGQLDASAHAFAALSTSDRALRYTLIANQTLLALGLWWWMGQREVLPRAFRFAAAALVVFLVVSLPAQYAVLVRCEELPRAQLTLVDGAAPDEVWLVQEAGDYLVVREQTGTLRVVPAKDVKSIRIKYFQRIAEIIPKTKGAS